jgi:8-oxo-dGTP diphosphatase
MKLDLSKVPDHMQVANIDWPNWQPEIVCTLMFVTRGDEVLLIRKKRGLGAGKINGPGGKVDPGETTLECAVRETQEELCVTAKDIHLAGELLFHAEDMPRIHAFAYIAGDFGGTPTETDEAIPIWFKINEIPFDEMWQDYRYWLGAALAGSRIKGWFSFEEELLLDYKIELSPNPDL